MENKEHGPGPGGRPTLYKKEYCQLLIEHMQQGLSLESFGGVVGVCEDTVYEWAKVHKEFSEAKRVGRAMSRVFWEKIAVENIISTDGIKFNTTLWIFNMKNRFKWRDNVHVEHTGSEGRNLSEEIWGKLNPDNGEL